MKKKKPENRFYVYIYLNPLKLGSWVYGDLTFDFEPFYVGKGHGDRINDHVKEKSLRENTLKNNIILKIKRNGLDPIRYKIFENLKNEESKEIERSVIKHFGRRYIDGPDSILANRTKGGDGGLGAKKGPRNESFAVDQFLPDGEFIREWNYIGEIHNDLGYCKSTVKKAIDNNSPAYGFIWRKSEDWEEPFCVMDIIRTKEIHQYTLSGKFVKSFQSMSQARSETGIRLNANSEGEFKQRGGYRWFFEYKGEEIDDKSFLPKNDVSPIPIYQYDSDGNFVRSYVSGKEAQRVLVGINVLGRLKGRCQNLNVRLFYEYFGDKIEPQEKKDFKKFISVRCFNENLEERIFKSIADACSYLISIGGTESEYLRARIIKAVNEKTKFKDLYWELL